MITLNVVVAVVEISKKGLDFIVGFEGFKSKPYHCSAGVSTIGIGTTIYPNGKHVTMQDRAITKEDAIGILKYMIGKGYGATVNRYVKVPLTQNQYDSLVSLVYNIGSNAFRKSTLLRKLNEGKYKRASKEFIRWNRSGHKILAGLTRRRKAESEMFLA